jgi:hypothetical protein
MKPLKSGLTFANWLLRIALAFLTVICFIDNMKTFNLEELSFYIAALFILSGILIFVGGFSSKPLLTVLSGFIITGLCIYEIILTFSGNISSIANLFVIMAIGFYFACAGNQ